MSFSFEQEINGELSFLDVEVSRQQGKFVTTFYRKPTFSGVYTHFDSFLPEVYKVGMIYTLAYRCFKICAAWTKFREELNFLKHVFLKNGFIDKCFKMIINKLVIKRPQVTTVETFKGIMNCRKFQIVFKSQRKLANVFRFKDCLPFDLVCGVVYKYTCGRCNSSYYGETDRDS